MSDQRLQQGPFEQNELQPSGAEAREYAESTVPGRVADGVSKGRSRLARWKGIAAAVPAAVLAAVVAILPTKDAKADTALVGTRDGRVQLYEGVHPESGDADLRPSYEHEILGPEEGERVWDVLIFGSGNDRRYVAIAGNTVFIFRYNASNDELELNMEVDMAPHGFGAVYDMEIDGNGIVVSGFPVTATLDPMTGAVTEVSDPVPNAALRKVAVTHLDGKEIRYAVNTSTSNGQLVCMVGPNFESVIVDLSSESEPGEAVPGGAIDDLYVSGNTLYIASSFGEKFSVVIDPNNPEAIDWNSKVVLHPSTGLEQDATAIAHTGPGGAVVIGHSDHEVAFSTKSGEGITDVPLDIEVHGMTLTADQAYTWSNGRMAAVSLTSKTPVRFDGPEDLRVESLAVAPEENVDSDLLEAPMVGDAHVLANPNVNVTAPSSGPDLLAEVDIDPDDLPEPDEATELFTALYETPGVPSHDVEIEIDSETVPLVAWGTNFTPLLVNAYRAETDQYEMGVRVVVNPDDQLEVSVVDGPNGASAEEGSEMMIWLDKTRADMGGPDDNLGDDDDAVSDDDDSVDDPIVGPGEDPEDPVQGCNITGTETPVSNGWMIVGLGGVGGAMLRRRRRD